MTRWPAGLRFLLASGFWLLASTGCASLRNRSRKTASVRSIDSRATWPDERAGHRLQHERHGPAQRDRLALHQHALLDLLVPPVGVPPPEQVPVLLRSLGPLVRGARRRQSPRSSSRCSNWTARGAPCRSKRTSCSVSNTADMMSERRTRIATLIQPGRAWRMDDDTTSSWRVSGGSRSSRDTTSSSRAPGTSTVPRQWWTPASGTSRFPFGPGVLTCSMTISPRSTPGRRGMAWPRSRVMRASAAAT